MVGAFPWAWGEVGEVAGVEVAVGGDAGFEAVAGGWLMGRKVERKGGGREEWYSVV